ncbi:MAG: short-chain dehydrogenase [Myxococcales bacterium]
MDGKRVLVTGATGGVATAFIEGVHRAGAELVLTGFGQARLDELAAQYGAAVCEADLSTAGGVAALIEATGAVDGVVHLTGGFAMGRVADAMIADYDRMMDLNLRSLFQVARAYVPILRERDGFLVAIGAGPGLSLGAPHMGLYAAAKAGVIALMRSIAAEEPRVRPIVLIPQGAIDTPANRAALPAVDPTTWIDPAELAAAVVFAATRSVRGRVLELQILPPA